MQSSKAFEVAHLLSCNVMNYCLSVHEDFNHLEIINILKVLRVVKNVQMVIKLMTIMAAINQAS